MTDFQLDDGERSHPLWAKIRAHLVDWLAAERALNDHHAPETVTAARRGRITAIKTFIALGDVRPTTER